MIFLMLLRMTFLLLLALLLAACGDDDDGSLETPTATNTAPGATATSPAVATATTEVTRPTDATTVPGANLLPVIAAREALAAVTGRTVEEIEVVSVTPKQWPDACLGIQRSGEVCAQVITPGYEVVLRLDGNVAIYRTDEGTNARLASGVVAVP
jgi:hypothetical protein